MNREHWQQINQIFHEAQGYKSSERKAFLEKACAGDEELLREVHKLLASHEKAGDFLESPAMAVAAKAIASRKDVSSAKPEPKRVFITITQGPRKGKIFVLLEQKIVVFGRANDCFEIMPEDDPTVGRHHFALEVNPPTVGVRDLGSLNGTYVNGHRIGGRRGEEDPRQPKRRANKLILLHEGDVIKAGDTMFRISLEAPVLCTGCGESVNLYTAGAKNNSVRQKVFCEDCWEQLRRESKEFVRSVEAMASVRSICTVCDKEVATEAGPWKLGEFICERCRSKMVKNKNLLQKLLNTTSSSGRPDWKCALKDYDIRKHLGTGRLGPVYLARGKKDRRQVAVKVIFSSTVQDPGTVAQYNSMLEDIRGMRHPNLLEPVDYGSAGGAFYCVTEYCDSGNISHLLAKRRGKLGLHEALPIMEQALAGLAFIHQEGLFHGNLKPGNILLAGADGSWNVRIADFGLPGIFRELGLGGLIASEDPAALAYTPPELLTGAGIAGPLTDVWSIAAIFYHMLTGCIPHERKREVDPFASLIEPVIVPSAERTPDIVPEVANLLDDFLKLNQHQRPQNAGEMLERLRKIQVRVVRLTLAR